MSSQILWWTEPRKLSMELPRHLPMAPFSPGLTGSLPSPQVWVPPWLAQLSQPSQAPEKDRLHDVSRDLGLFNKPCRQSTQLAYGSRLLMLHHIHIKRKTLCATKNALSRFVGKSGIESDGTGYTKIQWFTIITAILDHTSVSDTPTSRLCLWFLLGWLLFFSRFRRLPDIVLLGDLRMDLPTKAASLNTINYGKREIVLGKNVINQWIFRGTPFSDNQKRHLLIFSGDTHLNKKCENGSKVQKKTGHVAVEPL